MNLKESKQSKYLVGIYIDQIVKDNNLAACFHSIANQTLPVDLVILTHSLTAEEIALINELASKPFASYIERTEDGQVIEKRVESEKSVNYKLIELESSINFAKVFNTIFQIASDNGYEGISLAEPEDGYSAVWFETADKFSEGHKEVGVFVPIIRNMLSGAFSGVMNESAWVEGMSEESGKFDINLLQRFNCINPLGALYRVSSLLECSERDAETKAPIPMKESMKLSHYYEFFLRMIYEDVKIMTVPRIGYEVKMLDKEVFTDSTCKIPKDLSILPEEKGGMSQDEARFWFELAKKEFYYDEDRKKTYELPA